MENNRPEGFEWDDDKAAENLRKHKIAFSEAIGIFNGIVYSEVDDRFEYGETRETSIGYVQGMTALTVAHTDRNGKKRIITARKATKTERRLLNDHIKRTFG